jgi:hypothetical protein
MNNKAITAKTFREMPAHLKNKRDGMLLRIEKIYYEYTVCVRKIVEDTAVITPEENEKTSDLAKELLFLEKKHNAEFPNENPIKLFLPFSNAYTAEEEWVKLCGDKRLFAWKSIKKDMYSSASNIATELKSFPRQPFLKSAHNNSQPTESNNYPASITPTHTPDTAKKPIYTFSEKDTRYLTIGTRKKMRIGKTNSQKALLLHELINIQEGKPMPAVDLAERICKKPYLEKRGLPQNDHDAWKKIQQVQKELQRTFAKEGVRIRIRQQDINGVKWVHIDMECLQR